MELLIWCIGVLLLLIWFCVKPGRLSAAQAAPFYGVNHAHRGLYAQDQSVPENSLPAFAAAAEKGYGMELDIQLSLDGEVVVFHDDTLARMCGIGGRVDAFPLARLREMPLAGTAERMPLLTEVFDTVAGKAPIIIELKTGPRNEELCRKGLALMRAYQKQYGGAFCVESFDARIVAWFRKNAPDILRGQLTDSPRALGSGRPVLDFIAGNLLSNVIARPQFIAHGPGRKTALARFAEACGAMPVYWTAKPGDDAAALEEYYDAVIFEHYAPKPKYK
ncbi:MAG: glycerophosphodiester phosphodiesterase [Oscillospiraceae bacterium]|jgi:glycerophosphodiester phosphodiesterase|nr:glycerophosphodiester phosphodiesterase [Oscillospiraceae bacterium]